MAIHNQVGVSNAMSCRGLCITLHQVPLDQASAPEAPEAPETQADHGRSGKDFCIVLLRSVGLRDICDIYATNLIQIYTNLIYGISWDILRHAQVFFPKYSYHVSLTVYFEEFEFHYARAVFVCSMLRLSACSAGLIHDHFADIRPRCHNFGYVNISINHPHRCISSRYYSHM